MIVKRKLFSEDNDNYLGITEEFDNSKFSRKSDKWLKEVARYDGELTEKEKRNIKKNSALISSLMAASGAAVGAVGRSKNRLKGGLIGAGIGGAAGIGMAIGGHYHHELDALKAREELRRRK